MTSISNQHLVDICKNSMGSITHWTRKNEMEDLQINHKSLVSNPNLQSWLYCSNLGVKGLHGFHPRFSSSRDSWHGDDTFAFPSKIWPDSRVILPAVSRSSPYVIHLPCFIATTISACSSYTHTIRALIHPSSEYTVRSRIINSSKSRLKKNLFIVFKIQSPSDRCLTIFPPGGKNPRSRSQGMCLSQCCRIGTLAWTLGSSRKEANIDVASAA